MIFVNITGPDKKTITSYPAVAAPTKEESFNLKKRFSEKAGCSPDEIEISTSTDMAQLNKNILSVFGADGEFIIQTNTNLEEVNENVKRDYADMYGEGIELKITPYDQPYQKEIDEQQE
tara:strand:+ start:717 stop:1073 length:357 start_codon:yes stop_codon:yes gene_type:complete